MPNGTCLENGAGGYAFAIALLMTTPASRRGPDRSQGRSSSSASFDAGAHHSRRTNSWSGRPEVSICSQRTSDTLHETMERIAALPGGEGSDAAPARAAMIANGSAARCRTEAQGSTPPTQNAARGPPHAETGVSGATAAVAGSWCGGAARPARAPFQIGGKPTPFPCRIRKEGRGGGCVLGWILPGSLPPGRPPPGIEPASSWPPARRPRTEACPGATSAEQGPDRREKEGRRVRPAPGSAQSRLAA